MTITYGKVSTVESLGEHPGVSEVLVRDLLVSIKAQIEEVEHLSDDWSSGFGKVPKQTVVKPKGAGKASNA